MVVPDDGYLNGAHKLLKKHNALLIADEVQVGLCWCSSPLLACTACTSTTLVCHSAFSCGHTDLPASQTACSVATLQPSVVHLRE